MTMSFIVTWKRNLVASCLFLFAAGVVHAEDTKAKVPTSQELYDRSVKESEGREWKSIFNGKDLTGWKVVLANAPPGEDPEKIFQIQDEAIHVYKDTPEGKKMPFGVIMTDDSYSHYRLRFEYKWGQKKFAPRTNVVRDAGLLYHTIGPEKIWPMSVEYQIQENDTGDFFYVYTGGDTPVDESGKKFQDVANGGTFKPFFKQGGVTRVIKSETFEKEGWNQVEVVIRGDKAVHLINGKINNYCINMRAPQGPEQKVQPLTAGRISLQCECAEILYRKIEILKLPE